jgi:hypothetical protein
MNTVIKMSIQRMVCTGCGAEANASCNCGVSYVAKSVRAAQAVKANPGKSDRAIAVDLGIGHQTVGRARRESHGPDGPPDDERTGQDGKSYSIRQRITDNPDMRYGSNVILQMGG